MERCFETKNSFVGCAAETFEAAVFTRINSQSYLSSSLVYPRALPVFPIIAMPTRLSNARSLMLLLLNHHSPGYHFLQKHTHMKTKENQCQNLAADLLAKRFSISIS